MLKWSKVLPLILTLAATPLSAAGLKMAARNEPSVDPHHFWTSSNMAYNKHIFDPLVGRDENGKLYPALATEWKLVDDLTYELKLRQGVTFHDGSDFTAEDVKFSFDRVRNLANNPISYSPLIASVKEVQVVDPFTIRLLLNQPSAILPGQLNSISIVSKKVAENALPPEFRSGQAAIGTGPYKFAEFKPGELMRVVRNDNYWGKKAVWDDVTFRIIPNDSARALALLSGDVDVAEALSIADSDRVAKAEGVHLYKRPSVRLLFLSLDVGRDKVPFLTDRSGAPLTKNPFKDIRVRQAISKAINRPVIVDRLMEGYAVANSQLTPPDTIGSVTDLKVEKFDLAGAKKLLADAGWPDGFGMTLHCTNDRLVNDSKICEALGQMLSRLGLTVKVETMPQNVFYARIKMPEPELSATLLSWGHSDAPDNSPLLITVIHSFDPKRSFGNANRQLFSDQEIDKDIETASGIMEPNARTKALQDVTRKMEAKLPLIPLHTQYLMVGAKKNIEYRIRLDEQFIADYAAPAKK